jgi:hypothetical protein
MVTKSGECWHALHAEPGSCPTHGNWTPIPGSLRKTAAAAKAAAERFDLQHQITERVRK